MCFCCDRRGIYILRVVPISEAHGSDLILLVVPLPCVGVKWLRGTVSVVQATILEIVLTCDAVVPPRGDSHTRHASLGTLDTMTYYHQSCSSRAHTKTLVSTDIFCSVLHPTTTIAAASLGQARRNGALYASSSLLCRSTAGS